MLINEVAERTGLSQDTIRFYEKEQLISKPERKDNGYRQYNDTIVKQLSMIQRAKEFGFSLNEIKELSALLFSAQLSQHEMREKLIAKRDAINSKIAGLETIRDEINRALLGHCEHQSELLG